MSLYIKIRKSLYRIFFILFALAANFSISITQFGLGMLLVMAIIDWLLFKKVNYTLDKTPQQLEFLANYRLISIQYHPYYKYIFLYIFVRFLVILQSDNILLEIQAARDIWMMVIVPFVVAKIEKEKDLLWIFFALLLGLATTGAFNFYQWFLEIKVLGLWRAGAFNNVMPLTYTGTSGITSLLGLGYSFYLFGRQKKKWGMIFFLLSLFGFIGFVLSDSRGGAVAMLVAFIAGLAFFLRKKFLFLVPFALIAAILFFQSEHPSAQKLKAKFSQIETERQNHCGSFGQRMDMWKTGWQMVLAKPVLGFGEVGYEKGYQQFKMPEACDVAYKGSHMHNDYLHLATNFGIFGFFLLLMFYLFPVLSYYRNMYLNFAPGHRSLVLWSLMAIVLMAVLSLSQCHFIDDEVQMVFWLAVGIFLRFQQPQE